MTNVEPQVVITKQQNSVTFSSNFTVQAVPFTPVSAFRSYTFLIPEGANEVELEKMLLEKAIAITSLAIDLQLTVNHNQEPRFSHTWEGYEHYCPDRFKKYLGIGLKEVTLENAIT